MLGAQGLWAGKELYRATPTVTRDLGLYKYGLIRKTSTYLPQWDSNPRLKDHQIIAPDALTTAPRRLQLNLNIRLTILAVRVLFSQSCIPPYVLLRAVYRQKLAKLQGTLRAHVRCFYPADHTQRLAEEIWHAHNFLRAPCDYRFAVCPQGTFTKKERYPCDLLALVASLKWRVREEKWHSNNYGTRTCVSLSTCLSRVKYLSNEYNLSDLCLSSACAAWLARGTPGARTFFTSNGTSTCLLNVSFSIFACSVRVQLRELI
jgi:hypothetical protein